MASRTSLLPLIIVTALVASVAGVAAALVVAAYVLPPTVPDAATQRAGRSVQNAVDAEALSRSAAAMVRVYGGAGTATAAGTVFAPDQQRGAGVVLTADGWVAVERSTWSAEAALVSADGRDLTVQRNVDAAAFNLVFLKTDGRDLTVAVFGDSRTLEAGDGLFTPAAGGFAPVPFVSAAVRDGAPSLPETTADFRRRLAVAAVVAPPGTPVFTGNGELVGMALPSKVGEQGKALPVEVLRIALGRVLAERSVAATDIGVRGLPLASVSVPDPALAVRGGWYVTEVRRTDAGLRVGDLVRSVGSDAVTASRPLGEILAEYAAGARPELLVLRDGQELRIPVTLAP
ncbi:serine protease [Patescibacteria group bacterium]|nr:MAG: serine protease [Patescibacteria group bacterium]